MNGKCDDDRMVLRRFQRKAYTSQYDAEYGNSDLVVDYEEYERAGGITDDQGLYEIQRAMEAPTSRSNRPFLRKDVFQQLSPEGRAAWQRLSNEDRKIIVDKMKPDDDASKTKFSAQNQRDTTNRKANITESEFFGNEYVTNVANFGEEVTEDAEERLTASVHETSYPDERTDVIVNASAGRGPLPPGDVVSLLSDKTDRRSPVRTPGRQEQTSAPKPKGSIEKLTQQLNVFGKKKEGKRKGNMHLTNPSTGPGHAVSSHSRANKYYSLIDRGANGGIQGDDMRVVNIVQPERYIDVTGIRL